MAHRSRAAIQTSQTRSGRTRGEDIAGGMRRRRRTKASITFSVRRSGVVESRGARSDRVKARRRRNAAPNSFSGEQHLLRRLIRKLGGDASIL